MHSESRRIWIFLFFCFFYSYCGEAQSPWLVNGISTTRNGLTNNQVTAVIEDRMGLTWIGTYDGICCFDGYEFRQFFSDPADTSALRVALVIRMMVDRSNTIWIFGTGCTLFRYDRSTDRFIRVDPLLKKLLGGDAIIANTSPDSTVWVTGYSGVARFDHSSGVFVPYFYHKKYQFEIGEVSSFSIDAEGSFWIGAREDNLRTEFIRCVLEKNQSGEEWLDLKEYISIKIPRKYGHIQRSYNNFTITWEFVQSDKHRVYAVSNLGLYKLTKERKSLEPCDAPLPDEKFPGRKPLIWAEEGFLLRIRMPESHIIETVTIDSSRMIENWYYSDQGVLFLGGIDRITSEGFGLVSAIRTNALFKHIPIRNKSRNSAVFGIFRHKNVFLAAVRDHEGLLVLDKDRIAGQIPFHGKLAGAGIPGAVLPLGADVLWLGFSKDLLVKMDLKSGSQSVISDLPGFRKQIPGFYNFSKLFTLDEKTVWVAGTPGYFRFDPESLTVSDTFRLNLPDPVVYDILPGDSGDFWISSHGRIIHVIGHQVKSVTTILENHFNIVSLHNDRKGALWLALHGGGIVRFDMSTLAWRVYTRKDGLVNNSVYEILGDNRRNLWISSNTGISRFNPSTGEFWNFGTEDGLQIREFNGNAACSTPEGELLFGGMGGITRWFPDSLNNVNQKKSGTVMISMVKVAGVPVITDSAIYEKRVLHLPAGSDNLTFYFTCTDLRNASQLSFRYRLQGYEAAWTMADRRSRTCNFVNLGPGQYIFSVEASDAMGQWSRRTALTVIIPPLFHQTLLFRFLLFFSGILFLIFMVSWYIYQVKLAERKKQELIRLESLRSQLNPHFIFNALNPLNYMISSRDVPGANQYLADFSRLLRLFLTNSRSEFIHIGQEVETLQKYLTVEQARFGSMFDFDIVISQKLLDKMPEVAPSMVQPFLENSIMHGFCKKSAENKGLLTACFEPLDSGFVLCIIEDNGIGIAAGEIRTREHRKDHVSQGIKILEERLSLYNSMYNSDHKIRMEEVTPGAEEPGTRILLPVPINRNIKK